MKEQREKKISTLWKDLLSSALIRSEKKKANVLILGNGKTGKKSLINSMIKELGVEVEDVAIQETKGDEHIYIMDYKFMRVNQSLEEENDEIGKINFYILNRRYPHLKNFLEEKMFENLLILLVLDLSKPGEITHEFIDWITYIN